MASEYKKQLEEVKYDYDPSDDDEDNNRKQQFGVDQLREEVRILKS